LSANGCVNPQIGLYWNEVVNATVCANWFSGENFYSGKGVFILATLRDVAKLASVSVSTASRILSNSTKEKYSEETQLNVLRASLELGYRPNFAARALVSGETRIIAAVFPRIYDTPFTALASLQILSGIEAFCSENGYHTLLSSPHINNGTVDASFVNMMASGYPDGIILDSHFHVEPIMEVLHQFNLPMIVLGYSQHPYRLQSDNRLGGRILIEHMIELGHKRIGIIGIADGVSPAADERLQGMRAQADEHGLDFDCLPRVNGTFSSTSGAAAASELLTSHPKLTALVALNDRMAMGAMRQLQQMGYAVPERISVIGYDDLTQASEVSPPLTTVNQQLASWGGLAMNLLLELLSGKSPEPVVLQPRLVVRQSTAHPCEQSA
jgi:DNA-binding LacI/PurR family transcriptional regulator